MDGDDSRLEVKMQLRGNNKVKNLFPGVKAQRGAYKQQADMMHCGPKGNQKNLNYFTVNAQLLYINVKMCVCVY